MALLAPDQQILVLTSLGPSPPVIGGGPLIPGAARVTTQLSNKFGEREAVVQCRPGETERAIIGTHGGQDHSFPGQAKYL